MNPIAQLLAEKLEKRKEKNRNYSMRAFARVLGLEPSALSKILNCQRIPNYKTFQKIANKLGLTTEEQKRISDWLLKVNKSEINFMTIKPEHIEKYIEIYHLLMIEALRLPFYANSPDSLRQAMGMDEKIFQQALMELEQMNMLIYESEANQVKVLSSHNSNIPMIRSTLKLRNLQKSFLQLAIKAIDECSIECRDNSTLTVAISEEHLSYFKDLIAKFRRKISLEAEKNMEKANVIYNFSFAVYPVVKS